jgi:hypothetical protein
MVACTKGLGPEKDCAGKGQQYIKRQTRPLVREVASQKQDRNFQTVINIWDINPRWGSTPRLTDWLTVSRRVTLTLTLTLTFESVEFRNASLPGYELGNGEIELRNWGVRFIERNSVQPAVGLWREGFMCAVVQWYLECVIQWDCYSSCVKIRCTERG